MSGKAARTAAKPEAKAAAPPKAPAAAKAAPAKSGPKPAAKGVPAKAAAGTAAVAAKAARVGTRTRAVRIHHKVHFYKPKTLKLARSPKYARVLPSSRATKFDNYAIIKRWGLSCVCRVSFIFSIVVTSLSCSPLTTESAMKKIEENNTLVFLVDTKANKRQIKSAVHALYDIKAAKVRLRRCFAFWVLDCVCDSPCVSQLLQVNTLIRPDGRKKAYVRLTADFDALDVANRIGII